MASATWVDFFRPIPVLAINDSSPTTAPGIDVYLSGVTMTTSGDYYNLASISLGAGVWAVLGTAAVPAASGTLTVILANTSSGTGNSWVTVNTGSGIESTVAKGKGAMMHLTSTTTVYLNGSFTTSSVTGYGSLWAAQIG